MGKGYYFDKRREKYIVRKLDKSRKYIGAFETLEQAQRISRQINTPLDSTPSELDKHKVYYEHQDESLLSKILPRRAFKLFRDRLKERRESKKIDKLLSDQNDNRKTL